jgi:Rieske Fe-S protein
MPSTMEEKSVVNFGKNVPMKRPGQPVSAAMNYIKENVTAIKNFAEYLLPGELESAYTLKPGEGGILRGGVHKIAVCRDENGELHARSAVCTHLGCHVHWNSTEQCWDCPCHGSQFAPDGEVLAGPAIAPLPPAELPAQSQKATKARAS